MIRRFFGSIFAAALLSLLSTGEASSQVTVDKVIVTFGASERPIHNVIVRNAGPEALFVTVNATIVTAPGGADEKREPSEDLVASPKRFSLQGGGQRTVRLLLRRPLGQDERVYRIAFVPQAAPPDEASAAKAPFLKVLTGVGILIFAQPLEPRPKFRSERHEEGVTMYNEGNVNVLLSEGKACLASACDELPAARLYPGRSLQVRVPRSAEVTYRREMLGQFDTLVIPPS